MPTRAAELDLDDLQAERGRFRPGRVYGTSKLCNVLFTRELQRRHPELAVNCFHPGVIRTGFGKNDGALAQIAMHRGRPVPRSPERGARSLVWLALDPAAGELRGQYVEKERPVEPSAQAQDDAPRRRALGRAPRRWSPAGARTWAPRPGEAPGLYGRLPAAEAREAPAPRAGRQAASSAASVGMAVAGCGAGRDSTSSAEITAPAAATAAST